MALLDTVLSLSSSFTFPTVFLIAQINGLSASSICSSSKQQQAVHSASTPSSGRPSGIQQTRSLRLVVCRESRELGMCNQHPWFIKCLSVVIGDVACQVVATHCSHF